jgi:muramoyltetrapeptide carboxypeptidase
MQKVGRVNSLIKPRALKSGATIGVVAPGSTPKKDKLEEGIKTLISYGYRVVLAPHVNDVKGYLAGDDEERARDLNKMFADNNIDAVFCACGGYGSIRVLPYIDFDLVCKNPKIFIGYSDVTILHLILLKRCNFVTFYGPMVAVDLNKSNDLLETRLMWKMISDPYFKGEIEYDSSRTNVKTLVGGKVSGQISGGCLTLVDALFGTDFEINCKGKILFLEEVDEHFHDIDRMLAHLKLTGKLDDAVGFVIGNMVGITAKDTSRPYLDLEQIYNDYLLPLGKPTIINFPSGHGEIITTLPFGCEVELDADNKKLVLKEPATLI